MNDRKQVYISGWGVLSCAGIGIEESMRSFFSPDCSRLPACASASVGTALTDPVFELTGFSAEPGIRRSHSLALAAVREALTCAGLTEDDLSGSDTGVCFGTTTAFQLNDPPLYQAVRRGERTGHDNTIRDYLAAGPADFLCRRYHLTGPRICVSNACASGTDILGIAAAWLESGECRRVIAVGADDMSRVPVAGFHALGVASPEPCRPFDRDRKGLNLGEGAGALILETQPHRAPLIRLAGFGNACDAYHITSPHPEGQGLRQAVETALQRAGIGTEDIAFILAHGTATRANDLCEGRLFARMFGPQVKYLSTKGWTGHTLGAAGAMEAVFTIAMLLRGEIPASRGFHTPDPEIPVPPSTCIQPLNNPRFALSTSLAFGGSNAAVVLEKL